MAEKKKKATGTKKPCPVCGKQAVLSPKKPICYDCYKKAVK